MAVFNRIEDPIATVFHTPKIKDVSHEMAIFSRIEDPIATGLKQGCRSMTATPRPPAPKQLHMRGGCAKRLQ